MSIILYLIASIFVLDILLFIFRMGVKGFRTGFKVAVSPSEPYSISGKTNRRFLFVGDCTAWGVGDDKKFSVASRLARKYSATVINLGRNGAKALDAIKQIDSVDGKFDLIVIQVGNNDIVRFTRLNLLKKRIAILFDKAKKKSHNVIIFRGGNLGNLPAFPFFLRLIYDYKSRAVRNLIEKIAKDKNVIYVDLFKSANNDIFLKDIRKYYSPDLIHLKKEGYDVWFNFLLSEMGKNNVKL